MIACKFSEHHIAHMQLFYPPVECHSQGEARGKGGSKAGAFCESCCVSSPEEDMNQWIQWMVVMDPTIWCFNPNMLVSRWPLLCCGICGRPSTNRRQKKLAETQKLETMYSSLLEKFNDEETVFEENILSSNCFFLHFFPTDPGSDQTSPDKVLTVQLYWRIILSPTSPLEVWHHCFVLIPYTHQLWISVPPNTVTVVRQTVQEA